MKIFCSIWYFMFGKKKQKDLHMILYILTFFRNQDNLCKLNHISDNRYDF